jgi:hypothetical protein
MTKDARSRIRELCSEALAATSPSEIEPILTRLRVALHDKIHDEETWMSLCEKAAVEQDPKKILQLVSEINRRFRSRDDGQESQPSPEAIQGSPGSSSDGRST